MKKILSFIFVLCCTVFSLNAQITTSSMNGVVKSDAGTALEGATVTAVHLPTGSKFMTTSRKDGRFNLPNVRVGGPYTVTVTAVGFQKFVEKDITLTLGQEFALNVALSDVSVTLDELKVVGKKQDKIFNSSRTGSSETVTRTQIDRLPTINRSLQDYTKLTPSANGNSFGGRSSSFNNVTVDGALFNNSFGLSGGNLGAQTNSQPISLDAIEQIQVDIAPFDVRQGFFTGAGVNTVTKSGTNEIKGTMYYYLRSPDLVGLKAGTSEVLRQSFTYNTRGLSIGGPIVKNKLFYFFSGEQERLSQPATTLQASRNGSSGSNVSQAKAEDLDALKQFLMTKYNYNPGVYDNYNYTTQSDKITAKVDWNINANNTLSAKYFYLKSSREIPASNSGAINNGSRQPGTTAMPFNGSGYQINNNFNIGMIELNTRIGNKYANKATLGYTALRDFRNSLAGANFPLVDIGNGSGQTFTSFGYEPFTAFNKLNTDTWQFSDDFTIYAGKHEITVGTSNQLNSFLNGFAPTYYGNYQFVSLADFYNSANNGLTNASRYQFRYSALPDGSFPFASVKAFTFSLYGQDKFQVNEHLKLTYGIRFDMPYFPSTLDKNPDLEKLTFRNNQQIDVSQLPKTRVMFSPRIGFNWDAFGNGKTQVRGGTGIFTGQVPFVWISNQASNNGVQFGSIDLNQTNNPNDPRLAFNPDVNANRPTNATANSSYNVAVTDRNFKYPQVFRTNLAVDQKLPNQFVLTLEGAYTKDLNAVYNQNINLPTTGTALVGADNRIRYSASRIYGAIPANQGGNSLQKPNISDAILMTNTAKGYSYFMTAQLQKTFGKNLFGSVAYTYTQSKSVNDGGTIAQSVWRDRQVSGDPNADQLSYSNFYQPHRVIATVSYRKEYAKNFASSFGLVFEMATSGVVSYTYGGDLNGDGLSGNDLIYVPKTASDIVLVKDNTADPRTAAQIWSQLDNFIKQDSYLSQNRGGYAERNAGVLPYFKRMDLNFTQDFFVNVKGKRNTLRFTADIINVGNLINRDWGLYTLAYNGSSFGSVSPLNFKGLDAQGKPTFSFPYLDNANQIPITQSTRVNTSPLSRWQAQIGIRYIFN